LISPSGEKPRAGATQNLNQSRLRGELAAALVSGVFDALESNQPHGGLKLFSVSLNTALKSVDGIRDALRNADRGFRGGLVGVIEAASSGRLHVHAVGVLEDEYTFEREWRSLAANAPQRLTTITGSSDRWKPTNMDLAKNLHKVASYAFKTFEGDPTRLVGEGVFRGVAGALLDLLSAASPLAASSAAPPVVMAVMAPPASPSAASANPGANEPSTCRRCGRTMNGKRKDAVFCSGSCRSQACLAARHARGHARGTGENPIRARALEMSSDAVGLPRAVEAWATSMAESQAASCSSARCRTMRVRAVNATTAAPMIALFRDNGSACHHDFVASRRRRCRPHPGQLRDGAQGERLGPFFPAHRSVPMDLASPHQLDERNVVLDRAPRPLHEQVPHRPASTARARATTRSIQRVLQQPSRVLCWRWRARGRARSKGR
jgi:hypothetical protein